MTTATSMTRNLQIDNMVGDACVQKVTGALKGVKDVTTQSVKVGHAKIEADQSACMAACSAIGKVGYPAREIHDGDQSGGHKTSRPGVDAPMDGPPAGDHKGTAATKLDHDNKAVGGNKPEQDSKSGGSAGRIPMPVPSPAVAKTTVPAATTPHRN
jgi:copper chaperone CopZ